MTEYVVLLTGDEKAWEAASPAEQAAMYDQHGEFSRLLEERGHRITGGAQLDSSRTARVVRPSGDGTVLTEGPYVESVEQLGGFYVVESDDLDDLLELCAILARTGDTVEVRACLAAPE
ncbi:YciI family protein [Nocardioides humi]|uniref:YciI family protein n=1 Tax=Nocardioides humi TaxID=449461 RepID=A0ABN2B1E6_9ACTN|nr:YciI family protein [Nocardioides humi]